MIVFNQVSHDVHLLESCMTMKCKMATLAATAATWMVLIATSSLAAEPEPATATPSAPTPSVLASNPDIEKLLAPIREKHKVPGLVAGIVQGDRLTVAAAVGVRKAGSSEPITVNDKLHLGSNTKAMTATRIARLVEEGKLSWQSTVGEVFSHLKADLHADCQSITLTQLLTHRAGLPANASYGSVGTGSVVEQREALLKNVLSKPPVHSPGSKFLYSNVGYIVAGHMAEQVTGKSWEELMTAGLFEPLKMSSAGFGAPGTKDQIDQPWGHSSLFGIPIPQQFDNPPVLGPAGTVHCSIEDWGKFIALHLHGARGEAKHLKLETLQKLQAPAAGEDYALGWLVSERPWAGGQVFFHNGSNTMWFAHAWIAPKKNVAYLAATNQGIPAGQAACDAAILALVDFHDKAAAPGGTTDKDAVFIQSTPSGVRFGAMGPKPTAPAPTLFVFANDINGTLQSDDYNKAGKLLIPQGFICVALDLPCHGKNIRAEEPQGLDGWATRLRKGEDPISPFTKDASAVLDHLIAAGLADPARVAVCGTSRGGFAALHFAAAEPRVRCAAAFAPVTDLLALREFTGQEKQQLTNDLALRHLSLKLAGRPIWMCIGNNDERVDTDRAISFSRDVVKSSVAQKKKSLIELHVMTSEGHTIHPTAHEEAAAWMAKQFK
jgi:CubicO group peptidase (beta-lactamase class C family)/dienelactone hydrolase